MLTRTATVDALRPLPSSLRGRLARAGVFAGLSLILALSAHRVAGGAAPPTAALIAASVVLAALGWALTGRERSGRVIGALVVFTQGALHVGFTVSSMFAAPPAVVSGRPTATPSLDSLAALLLCHHGTPVSADQVRAAASGLDLSSLTPAPTHVAAAPAMFGAGDIAMLLGHLLAAGVMAWWLRRGERAAWAGTCRVARVLLNVAAPLTVAAAGSALVPLAVRTAVSRRWAGALSGRGPPAHRLVLAFA